MIFIGSGLSTVLSILLLLVGVALPAYCLFHILTGRFPGREKLLWALVVIGMPLFGSIIYLVIGRQNRVGAKA